MMTTTTLGYSIITNLPVNRSSSLASSKIDRTSFTVVIAALTSLEIASAHEMITLAIVVLPHLKRRGAYSKLKSKSQIRLQHTHSPGRSPEYDVLCRNGCIRAEPEECIWTCGEVILSDDFFHRFRTQSVRQGSRLLRLNVAVAVVIIV